MQVIKLTNRKKITMNVPNGEGGLVELAPGETRLVQGDFEYFHRMPAQGMNGLDVKIAEGEKVRLLEGAKKLDHAKAVITNHKKIPMRLATGVGQKAIDIPAGETSPPTLVRLSVVKQMSGISVLVVEDDEPKKEEQPKKGDESKIDKKPADDEPKTDDKPEGGEPTVKTESEGGLKNGADAAAIAEAAKKDEALAKRRRDLALPATGAEWEIHKEQMTWPDVRGLAKELGIKTKNLTKDQLLEEVTNELYPS